MIKSRQPHDNEAAQLADLVAAEARRRGISGVDVAMALLERDRPKATEVEPAFPDYPREDIIYDEVPEGMIDFPSAARKYSLNRGTLRTWLVGGHLSRAGRLKGPAPGGGFVLLFEDELIRRLNSPRLPGRPKTRRGKGTRRTHTNHTT